MIVNVYGELVELLDTLEKHMELGMYLPPSHIYFWKHMLVLGESKWFFILLYVIKLHTSSGGFDFLFISILPYNIDQSICPTRLDPSIQIFFVYSSNSCRPT
jgi:hypothetical protein